MSKLLKINTLSCVVEKEKIRAKKPGFFVSSKLFEFKTTPIEFPRLAPLAVFSL